MSAAHAKLSPSASSRWIRCPGSIALSQGIEREGNSASMLGTQIHQVGENLLNGDIIDVGDIAIIPDWNDPTKGTEFKVSTSMLNEASDYNDYVRLITNHDPNSVLIVEMKVDLQDIAPDTFGHADAVVIESGNLHVIDLKTGAGLVSAENNSQLMLYAYGVYQELEIFHDIDNIILHIVQNNDRVGGDRSNSWDLSPEDLITWIEGTAKPAAKEALSENAKCVPGETQCKWCDAASFCTALHDEASKLMDEAFDDLDSDDEAKIIGDSDKVTIEQVVKFLEKSKLITNLITSYEGRIYIDLSAGKEVPGFKLVQKQTRKKWADELLAFDKLKTWTKIDDIAPRKLVTPNQAEKLLGKLGTQKKRIFSELWVKPEGDITIAPLSDKRPAVTPAIDTFENLDEL